MGAYAISDTVIDNIKNWNKNSAGLFNYVRYYTVGNEGLAYITKNGNYLIDTRGFKDNEKIITAMKSNIDWWKLHFKKYARKKYLLGGQYIFRIKAKGVKRNESI